MFVFDLTACQFSGTTKNHGGGEYALEILKGLIANKTISFCCIYNSALSIDNQVLSICREHCTACLDIREIGLIPALRRLNCSIFYSAMPYTYAGQDFSNIRFVGTIHGLRDIEIQKDEYMCLYEDSIKGYIKSLMKNTKLCSQYIFRKRYSEFEALFRNPSFEFIVPSFYTKYSILSFFPFIEESQISVYYSPCEYHIIDKNTNNEKYYLLLSGNRWLKNNYRALKAIDNLISKGKIKNRTIITGACSKRIYKKLANPEYFTFLPYVSHEELDALFANAYCFIYPSLNEGFGYPPLRAMGNGVPTIVSACTSIPEVCGNAALYFNPQSIPEIENRILQIENDEIRNSLIENGNMQFISISKKQKEGLYGIISYLLDN